MRTLYFQSENGAAGDMICAALMALVPDQEKMLEQLNNMKIPGVEYVFNKIRKNGIEGNQMTVFVHGEAEGEGHSVNAGHHHSSMENIEDIIKDLQVSSYIKNRILEIYNILAEAESKAHGCQVSEVHFHEVGAMDAIADIAGACLLIEEINPSEILSSHIHVGNGTIHCAHGALPIPAPATAYILEGLPYEHGNIDGEICTPTGAALLKYFVDRYADFPFEKFCSAGVGLGKRNFSAPSYFAAYMIGVYPLLKNK